MIYSTQSVSGALSNFQSVEPIQHSFDMLWRADQVHEHLRNLHETIHLLKSVQKELEDLCLIKKHSYSAEGGVPFNHLHGLDSPSSPFNSFGNEIFSGIVEIIKENKVCPDVQESLALEAANSLVATLKSQLVPFNAITSQAGQWEEKSIAVKLAQKLQKHLRNKHWKKRKRRRVSEILQKEYEGYAKADQDADEWRANEIAKDIAKRKMENMKSIAKLKAMEERKRLESELELVLVVEKLQELRSIRIHKLKKQGHFLPEEDDKFLERVKASVEEEERQASTAANTHAAKDAISTAEEISKAIQITKAETSDVKQNQVKSSVKHEQASATKIEICSTADTTQSVEPKLEGQGVSSAYESVTNLPFEFYHYYHGSNNDMGTLIEVRRIWDAYIRPGGSRIPGHWVQAPPPSDEVWASYLVGSKNI